MHRRLRVFISALVDEMAAERGAAAEAVAGMLLAPVLFELASRSTSPRSMYQAYLEHCDVFVGIYGERYGDIPDGSTVSELEDQYLLAAEMPRLLYVDAQAAAREGRLADLLGRIEADARTSYKIFRDPTELASLLADDLAILLTERFDMASGPATQSAAGGAPRRQALPSPPTPLVGRDADLATIRRLLCEDRERLVTLTGPGGIGKTRLALGVASDLQREFRDGVWMVQLAALADPALVAPTIAFTLGVRESAGTSPFDSLKGYLREQQTLLVLDNFERVAAAGPLVADLLSASPGLQVLVTSRALLRVRGEREHSVLPLSLDSGDGATGAAVQLFVDRAIAANPSLSLSPENLAAVGEICRRLDGLPLAIELAAARTRLLPPVALLARLTSRLAVLTGGAADLPDRQRTLRAALDWDYDLLDPDERVLFQRLSVFADGWTLEAADEVTAIAADTGLDALDGLDSLLGKSLVRQYAPDGAEPRFGMLETLREYAREKLGAGPAAEQTSRRHAEHFVRLAESGRRSMRGPGHAEWLQRLEREHDNLREVLRWTDERVDVDLLLRLCAALIGFWKGHAHFTEGRRWLDRALSLSLGQRTALRAQLLQGAGWMSRARGDYAGSEQRYAEALSIRQELGDLDDVATALRLLGNARYDLADPAGGEALWRESLRVRPPDGDRRAAAETLNNLGVAARDRGDLTGAVDYYRQALAIFTEVGDDEGIARIDMNLGHINSDLGCFADGVRHAQAAIARFSAMGTTWDLVECLDFLGANLAGLGQGREAVRMFGASHALRETVGAVRSPRDLELYEGFLSSARRLLSPAEYDAAWAEGAVLTLEDTIAAALAQDPDAARS